MITIRCTRSRGPRGFFCLHVFRRGPVNVAVITLKSSAFPRQYSYFQCEHQTKILTRKSMADTPSEKQTHSTGNKSTTPAAVRQRQKLGVRMHFAVTIISVLSVPLFLLSCQYRWDLAQTAFLTWGIATSVFNAPLHLYVGLRTGNRTDLA